MMTTRIGMGRGMRGAGALGLAGLILLSVAAQAGPLPMLAWRTEIISTDAILALEPSFAIGPDGEMYAAWLHVDATSNKVHLAKLGVMWEQLLVITSASNAIVTVGPDDEVHFFYRTASEVHHRWGGAGAWDQEILTTPIGTPVDAEVAADGTLYLLLDRSSCLTLASKEPASSWTYEAVSCSDLWGHATDLDLDAAGRPHVVYQRVGDYVHHVVRVDGVWFDTFVTKGNSPAVAVDGAGIVHIAADNDAGQLNYATSTGVGWALEVVPTSVPAIRASIATDSTNTPHISFTDRRYSDTNVLIGHVHYTTRASDGSWERSLVDPEGMSIDSVIRVDSTDTPRIVYRYARDQVMNLMHSDLRFAEPITAPPARVVGPAP